MSLKFAVFLTSLTLLFVPVHGRAEAPPAARAESKLQHIEKNGEQPHPDPSPTEFSENEINAYFASRTVKLPTGVRSVIFRGGPGVVTASCNADFDQLTAGRRSANPLLSLFSGVHEVVVTANARGAAGRGVVEVQTVTLDGVTVPRFVLELFVEKFLQPKYPDVGMESRFQLPDKIDSAAVGNQKLVVTQGN